ncbi:hypothetical protein GALMADRAFT_240286 [Galerina marginata CBS 339.88]|uniref:Metallo-beta-lactamase domain-containing protein n=1 Tax=Galerina marginata (strain CBS 339.88) TaxID=685588 RepID=A0A067TPZ8_GALM3|nr:hypothetical protein GALMADRAFT_240286 [Galerina marginata CBS 339.88]
MSPLGHFLRISKPFLQYQKCWRSFKPFVENQSHGVRRSLSSPSPYKSAELRHTEMASLYGAWIMENREELENVTRLSDNVIRVLGQNPGKFTLQGTNTYVIGSQNPHILIDTAEGLDSYIPVLKSALESPTNATQPDVSDIILSHWHHDHVGGIPSVLTLLKELWEGRNADKPYTPPRLHKYPVAEGANGEHLDSHWNKLPKLIEELPKDLYTHTPDGGVFHDLSDNQVFEDAAGSPVLRVLHTPGHTVDSVALHIPPDRALYTADTVLGHGTAVFEDLATYLASLNRMLHFGAPAASPPVAGGDTDLEYVSLYPGHGAVVVDGRETIATYIKHRLEREGQVLAALQSPIPAEFLDTNAGTAPFWTTWNLVRILYKTYPETLWLPAARGIHLHLKKLEGDGFVQCVGGEGKDCQWKLLVSPPSTPSL